MPEERNALAEQLDRVGVELCHDQLDNESKDTVRKAQRIVAELAKVVCCKEPERIMPIDKPYDDITLYAPYDNGLTESNSINEDEKRFIFDLANVAWKCRAIAEEGANNAEDDT